jgi:succinate-semialdehyde dehydrogenase / glutarate-semialdehyde dehydrogenase
MSKHADPLALTETPVAGHPGAAVFDGDHLVSSNPVTGAEVGRVPLADAGEVAAAVERAREAGRWWADLGFAERRRRLLRWRARITRELSGIADLIRAENGKPVDQGVVEAVGAVSTLDWAARHARRVLRRRRAGRVLVALEAASRVEYQPYGVVGVIGPWNYPVLVPMSSIAYALAAGNAVVYKPSEYTPVVGQWLVDTFAEEVGEHQVLQAVHGGGEVGSALCHAGVDKLSFIGSTATARKVMAACAQSLTPVTIEAGGKDAMIVDSDADLDTAADSGVWGALTNTGQSCVGIERVYAVDSVYDQFVSRLVAKVRQLRIDDTEHSDLGPITMPAQVEVIRRHLDDALARGARALVGGGSAVQPPFVHPTVLVDVPPDALIMREETFGPVLTISRVADADEALRLANNSGYGLGGAVFGRKRAMSIARRLRSGMASVNHTLGFAAVPSVPWGGVGSSGVGRVRGDDGLREFSQAKSVVVRQARPVVPWSSFNRTAKDIKRLIIFARIFYGRSPR